MNPNKNISIKNQPKGSGQWKVSKLGSKFAESAVPFPSQQTIPKKLKNTVYLEQESNTYAP